MNTSINKYNNQYLKCIVTKYKSTINVLANSGSLIVFKPNDNEERSYIYLGNTFLASGYGFATENKLKVAERIVNTYDDTIQGLNDTDANLRNTIENNYNTLLNKLKEYINTGACDLYDNGNPLIGNITNTQVQIEGVKVPLINLIQHGREADYQDLEIKKVTKYVVTENKTYTIDESTSKVNIPIGTIINKVIIKIEYDPHDSGGIGKLLVKYVSNNNAQTPKSIYVYYDGEPVSRLSENQYEKTFILDLTASPETPSIAPYIVKNEDIDVIHSVYAVILKSPEYKYYPELEALFNIHIHSTVNSILEHDTKNLASLSIHPMAYIKYNDYATATPNVNLDNLKISNALLDDANTLIYDFINIAANTRRVLISIPSIYKVKNISFIPNETSNNYLGNEEYNWSGSFSISPLMNISYQQISNPLCVVSKIYDITISPNENELPNGLLKITLINEALINNPDNNKVRISYNKTLQYNSSNNKRFINESFDNIYWVNSTIEVEKRLKEIYKNGVDIAR